MSRPLVFKCLDCGYQTVRSTLGKMEEEFIAHVCADGEANQPETPAAADGPAETAPAAG